MKFIVAVDEKWGIGKDGDLLLSIPDDMKLFRETTRRAVLVMGYNTLLSFPGGKPLPNRMNIVLADIEGARVPGTVICGGMEQLFGILRDMDSNDIFVIGGGSIYRQLMPYCDTAYITKMSFDGGADTFIPSLDEQPGWRVEDESEEMEHEGVRYRFVTYRNTAPEPIGFSDKRLDMPAYFCKKPALTVAMSEDKGYRDELGVLLRAYFRPLGDGVDAAEVAGFLNDRGGTFEAYLRDNRYIALREDIAALAEKYGISPDNTATVTVDKDKLTEFI